VRPLLVVGGTGLLGRRLAALAASDRTVVATAHTHPPCVDGVRWASLDLRDAPAVHRLFVDHAPSCVVNCAYVQHGPAARAVTAYGAYVVAAAAAHHGAAFVHLSSDAVFSGSLGRPYRETDEPDPVNEYGRAKADAERLVRATHRHALLVRTSLLYAGDGGPLETGGPQEQLVARALAGEPIRFFTDEIRNPIRAAELAAAIVRLVDLGAHGIWHLAGPEALSRYEFAVRLARVAGADPSLLVAGRSDGSVRPRSTRVMFDSGRALARLGPFSTPVPCSGTG
jgi:dTDP-4-dehydrorhamnose reductase